MLQVSVATVSVDSKAELLSWAPQQCVCREVCSAHCSSRCLLASGGDPSHGYGPLIHIFSCQVCSGGEISFALRKLLEKLRASRKARIS